MTKPQSPLISRKPMPLSSVLRSAGLRSTRQRIALAQLLRSAGPAHVSAESMFALATEKKIAVSLATIYNTLQQFCEVGLLRKVAIDGQKVYFDTNVAEHYHFAAEDRIIDIPAEELECVSIPDPPEGHVISGIDITVRLKRLRSP